MKDTEITGEKSEARKAQIKREQAHLREYFDVVIVPYWERDSPLYHYLSKKYKDNVANEEDKE